MNWTANWIVPQADMGDLCPEFVRSFSITGPLRSARLSVTAMGTYDLRLNGAAVSDDVLSPGFTAYGARHQYQTYELTGLRQGENTLTVTVGRGWYGSRGFVGNLPDRKVMGIIAQLALTYEDGRTETLVTDESWRVRECPVRFSEIYDGETVDARITDAPLQPVAVYPKSKDVLIPQEGERILPQEKIAPRRIFRTPKGETVVDFGQEVTGFVEFTVAAKAGDVVEFTHGEVLDRDGNFYNENYRSAKARLRYVCRDGVQTYRPRLTFFGFRYIRLDAFPGTPEPEQFTAVLVSSDLRRTGYIRCGDPMVNRLFENVIWGQRDNYLDVPTDCPQRDERQGWTGDAQVFIKTGSYNFDVRKFFKKWLRDMTANQYESGGIPHVIPSPWGEEWCGAAWADASLICPWQIYQTYGDREVLAEQYDTMVRYIGYIGKVSTTPHLWTGCAQFGDWLGLDAPAGSYKGSSREDFIASAFYAYDAALLAEISAVLGRDPAPWQALHGEIVTAFRAAFPTYETQTEMVLALTFGLTPDPAATAAQLAAKVTACGKALETGFVGTPYLLYALSRNGYGDLAYDLLLRREYPSWLYSVGKGATTVWEHWDGITRDGGFWSKDMNSFNHYAYGSVMGWVYEEAAGITPAAPGFARASVAPKPDKRLGWLEASIDTAHGRIFSGWYYEQEGLRYEIHTPVETAVCIEGETRLLPPGRYLFFSSGKAASSDAQDGRKAHF